MGKSSDNKVSRNYRIDVVLVTRLDQAAEATSQSRTAILEKSLTAYFDQQYQKDLKDHAAVVNSVRSHPARGVAKAAAIDLISEKKNRKSAA